MATKIDGSIMEGGGQILRNTITFSCLLNSPVHIYNIRAGRPKPGLAAQHMTGLELVRDLCSGRLDGATIGSTSVNFHPSKVKSGNFTADTRTAGSICLLIQVSLPCLLYGPATSKLILKGGTNAEMAPQIDYMTEVFQPCVEKFGVKFNCDIVRRGYYPKGGGEVHLKVHPTKELRPVEILKFGRLIRVTGRAFVAGVLPYKIAQRMAQEANRLIKRYYKDVPVDIEAVQEQPNKAVGTGSGILIVAESSTGCRIAGSALGKKGLPAEEVVNKAVEELTRNFESGGCVDEHLQDQLIIFMALARGTSRVLSGPITMHTRTAIHIAENITKAKFNIQEQSSSERKGFVIECEGIGLTNDSI